MSKTHFIEVLHEMRDKFCDKRLIVWQIVLSLLATCNISRQHFARSRLILVQSLLVKDQKKVLPRESLLSEKCTQPRGCDKSHLSEWFARLEMIRRETQTPGTQSSRPAPWSWWTPPGRSSSSACTSWGNPRENWKTNVWSLTFWLRQEPSKC